MKRTAIPKMSPKTKAKLKGKAAYSTIKKKPRKPSETLRIYGPPARREFVKRLPCAACGVVGYSENAHLTPKGEKGTGYKGDYRFIAPLCGPHIAHSLSLITLVVGCHTIYDKYRRVFNAHHPHFDPVAVAAETLYPCMKCPTMRTKAEGGTTFTICEECWDKEHPPAHSEPPVGKDSSFEELLDEYTVRLIEHQTPPNRRIDAKTCPWCSVSREALSRYVAKQREREAGRVLTALDSLDKTVAEMCEAKNLVASLQSELAALDTDYGNLLRESSETERLLERQRETTLSPEEARMIDDALDGTNGQVWAQVVAKLRLLSSSPLTRD